MVSRTINLLQNYSCVKLFLDNDEAGNKATTRLINEINLPVTDYRYLFNKYKDLNDYLINEFEGYLHSQSWF